MSELADTSESPTRVHSLREREAQSSQLIMDSSPPSISFGITATALQQVKTSTQMSTESDAKSQCSTTSETLSPLSKSASVFPLMKLPPELRLHVFDQLFTDLTTHRQRHVADLSMYHRKDEWPKNDFSAYVNLLLTCKEVHDAARDLWENVYIRQCCFYFWKLPNFYDTARALEKLGGPYGSARYALRTRAFDEVGLNEADFVDNEGEDLISEQPGFPRHDRDYKEIHWTWPKLPSARGVGAYTLYPDGRVPVEIYEQGSDGQKFGRATYPCPENLSLSMHVRTVEEDHSSTQYLLMIGEMGDVFWGGYDVGISRGKQLIWEEWERRDFPDKCLAKANIVLEHRTQLEAGLGEWDHGGRTPNEEDDVLKDIQEVYDLNNWFRQGLW